MKWSCYRPAIFQVLGCRAASKSSTERSGCSNRRHLRFSLRHLWFTSDISNMSHAAGARKGNLHREQNAGHYSGAMSTNDLVFVRAVQASDFIEWAGLYRGYRAFYALSSDESIVERVWTWTNDGTHEVNAFVASCGERLVGLAHYRRFARPSSGSVRIRSRRATTHVWSARSGMPHVPTCS